MPPKDPSLAEVIRDAIKSRLLDMHVALPARIEKYDSTTQQANVLPLLKRQYTSGVEVYPVIPNVPVLWPSAAGGRAFMHMPLAVGDTGLLVFSERSLDTWLSGTGAAVLPGDARYHNLSDAIFIPGLRTFKAPLQDVDGENMVLQNTDMRITISPDGKISIQGSTAELLGIIDDTLSVLISAGVVNPHGGSLPFDASTIAAFTGIQAALATIKRV